MTQTKNSSIGTGNDKNEQTSPPGCATMNQRSEERYGIAKKPYIFGNG